MEWDKKIPLGRQDQPVFVLLKAGLRPGRQDGQDIAILNQKNPDNPVNPVLINEVS
jgi:hypothetical protein